MTINFTPKNDVLIMDSFAGGGGASTGIELALGRSPDLAINHNPAALALHAANHPETLHLSENVYKVDPLDYLRRRHVGLAWFSPDCKHFSKAKGGKPVERNIRDLCWIIPGWIERIQKSGGKVDVVIMENVEEFKDYGPLMQTERGLMPDPTRKGATFKDWCKKLRKLGGKIEFRELRACDYGAPTIRKRLFVIVRFDGKPIVWPEPTHAKPTDPDVIAGRKLAWRTAAECIDWSLPCPSIFDTSDEVLGKHGLRSVRPLAHATMSRVARGMKRYVLDAERPFLVQTGYGERKGQDPRCMDSEAPLGTVVAGGVKHAVVAPNLMSLKGSARRDSSANHPHPTVLAGGGHSAIVAPHIMTMRNAGKPFNGADEPAHTITAGGAGLSLVAPVLSYAQQGGANRSVEDPHHTICASQKDQNQVALAFIAQHNNDNRRIGGVNPGRDAQEPMSTVTATGAQQGVVSAFVSRQFGASVGHGIEDPSATVTAGVNKSALVAPYMQKYYGTGDGSRYDEPGHTVTVKDRFGHVEAAISAPPFSTEMECRARQVASFMRGHGFWDEREFVTLTIAGETYVIVDIGMRMLTPRELYNAQGFPAGYRIDADSDGNAFPKSVQVSCVGNSVSPPVARALVSANCGHLAVANDNQETPIAKAA
ncbi:DNA cytosine methyltransferase [Agrobacterium tumefaciens]|uniref:DNA cytosine methyltransferase n=1 Tax=Agrobacterium tumefaciens TaxID=358 RepID=UPI0015731DD8|nr:DNA cytosine methyltransferase [Agrobacterium tumefaciens]NTA16030.1 C-5 cytosine-specific DNA methylase [Agrobacterium tumefaciens]WCK69602.1 DNA cytosine methyltransferase [Agrobacterium tumefaciens]